MDYTDYADSDQVKGQRAKGKSTRNREKDFSDRSIQVINFKWEEGTRKMWVQLQGSYELYCICDLAEGLAFESLPWGQEQFDVSICIFDRALALSGETIRLIDKLVAMNTDWFEVLGPRSEQLHDEIDLAGVRAGRQRAVGEGSPMTGWDEKLQSPEDMASEGLHLGGCDYKLVILLGEDNEFNPFINSFKKRLFEESAYSD